MTAKKARAYAIKSAIVMYLLIAYQGIKNFGFSACITDIFLLPILTVIVALVVLSFLTKGRKMIIKNDEIVPVFQFWAMILLPIIFGLFVLVFVTIRGTFNGTSGFLIAIVLFIGLNGRDLIRGKDD